MSGGTLLIVFSGCDFIVDIIDPWQSGAGMVWKKRNIGIYLEEAEKPRKPKYAGKIKKTGKNRTGGDRYDRLQILGLGKRQRRGNHR